MKTTPLLWLLAVVILLLPAKELSGQCSSATAQVDLDVNDVSARLKTAGDLWWDGSDAKYITPKNSNPVTTSLFAGSLWMAGFDPGGNLHMAAQTYGGSAGSHEFWPGPLDPLNPVADATLCSNWDRFFEYNKTEVVDHVLDFQDNGVIDNTPAANILGWPARGNAYFFDVHGFDLPASNQGLAPFWDEDQNGLYDPYAGDYPLVKGDQAFWWVMNDVGNIHSNSQGAPLTMEIQVTAFSYKEQEVDFPLQYTTFYEYKLLYRGVENLDSTYFSLWVDPDLGCWADDFIGCDVDHEMGLLYNGDDFDEDCSGLNGFKADIPVLGVKTIEVTAGQEALPFSSFAYYFNASSGQPVGSTDPSSPIEIYNYMTGSWRDGTPFSQGGTGYNPGEAPYPYAFDGSLVDGLPWTECNANSTPADRRFLMNYGPATLEPGEISTFAFAVLWKPSQTYPCPDFTDLLADGDLAETFYQEEDQNLMNGGIVNKTKVVMEQLDIQLLPHPMTTTTQLLLGEGLPALQQVELYNINGQRLHHWANIQSNSLEISRTYLSNGLYFLKIQLTDGRQCTRKLVIR